MDFAIRCSLCETVYDVESIVLIDTPKFANHNSCYAIYIYTYTYIYILRNYREAMQIVFPVFTLRSWLQSNNTWHSIFTVTKRQIVFWYHISSNSGKLSWIRKGQKLIPQVYINIKHILCILYHLPFRHADFEYTNVQIVPTFSIIVRYGNCLLPVAPFIGID